MSCLIYNKKIRPVKGVLFDMDGVILDTEKLYARFWQEGARVLGYPMTYEQALGMRSLNKVSGAERLREYFGPAVSYEQVREMRIARMEAYIDQYGVESKPGVRELLAVLREKGIPYAITTSSPPDRVEKHLGKLGLLHLFPIICSGYQVAHGKPAPDIYLYGAERIGVAPEDCLALEDSPAGLLSAHRAGCMPVFLPDLDRDAEEQLLYARCDSLPDVIELLD